MRVTEMDVLFAYNGWATARILNAAGSLSDEEFIRTDIVPVSFGSLRGALVHMLDVERSTRLRLSRNVTMEPLDEANYTSISQVSQALRAEATAMKDYLIGLEDEHMDNHVSFPDGKSIPCWQLLMHMIQHSGQHRSEVAVLLTALDRSPGELDFPIFLRESRS
jgi:uncharacterized damage-inducible protein DinB